VPLAQRLIVIRSDAAHQTKRGDSRLAQIAPMAAEVLRKLSGGNAKPGEAYVFRGPKSDQLSYVRTSRLFRKYRRLAKLPESPAFHSLRKTYGALPASAGVPIRSIQKFLGHSDVRITAEIYADVLSDAVRDQVEGGVRDFRHVMVDRVAGVHTMYKPSH
jgi:integrase